MSLNVFLFKFQTYTKLRVQKYKENGKQNAQQIEDRESKKKIINKITFNTNALNFMIFNQDIVVPEYVSGTLIIGLFVIFKFILSFVCRRVLGLGLVQRQS